MGLRTGAAGSLNGRPPSRFLSTTGFPQNKSLARKAAVANDAPEFVMHGLRHLGQLGGWCMGGSLRIAYHRVGGDVSQRTPPSPPDSPPTPPAPNVSAFLLPFIPACLPPTSTHLTESNLNKADADEDEKIGDEESNFELNGN